MSTFVLETQSQLILENDISLYQLLYRFIWVNKIQDAISLKIVKIEVKISFI